MESIKTNSKSRACVLVTANQKGGCGKTTTTVSLASALALKGYFVTIVDCDGQTNATQAFGIDPESLARDQYTVVDAYLSSRPADQIEIQLKGRFGDRLFVVPGSRGISSVSMRFDSSIAEQIATHKITDLDADEEKDSQRQRLQQSIDAIRADRDFILIDTPPEVGFPLTTSLIAADYYLIPIIPSAYDIKGLEQLLRTVKKVKDRYRPHLSLLGLLLCKVKNTKLDQQMREYLESSFSPEEVFKTEIGDSVKHREAPLHSLSIHEHVPGENPSKQYMDLADEVLSRLGKIHLLRSHSATDAPPGLVDGGGEDHDLPLTAVGD